MAVMTDAGNVVATNLPEVEIVATPLWSITTIVTIALAIIIVLYALNLVK